LPPCNHGQSERHTQALSSDHGRRGPWVERPDRVLPLRDDRCRHAGRTGEGRREGGQLGRIPPEVWAALLDDAKARPGAREVYRRGPGQCHYWLGRCHRAGTGGCGWACGPHQSPEVALQDRSAGAESGASAGPQKPRKSAARWAVPTRIPRTKRHTPVHLLCALEPRRNSRSATSMRVSRAVWSVFHISALGMTELLKSGGP